MPREGPRRRGGGAGACAVARVMGTQHGGLRAGPGGSWRSGGDPAALSLTPRPEGERRMNSKGARGKAAGPAWCAGRGQRAFLQAPVRGPAALAGGERGPGPGAPGLRWL